MISIWRPLGAKNAYLKVMQAKQFSGDLLGVKKAKPVRLLDVGKYQQFEVYNKKQNSFHLKRLFFQLDAMLALETVTLSILPWYIALHSLFNIFVLHNFFIYTFLHLSWPHCCVKTQTEFFLFHPCHAMLTKYESQFSRFYPWHGSQARQKQPKLINSPRLRSKYNCTHFYDQGKKSSKY